MAQNDVHVTNQPRVENEEEKLKYLEFVQVTVLHAIVYASKVYGYAKDNSGALKPRVETIEGSIKTVLGPAYEKLHHVPIDVLKFVDRKVDESVTKLPPFVKLVSSKTKNLSTMASEVKAAGVVETTSGLAKTAYTKLEPTAKGLYSKYEPAAKGLYSKYEPVAEQYAVSAWYSLNQLPVFPKVAKAVVPKVAYYLENYNQTVQQTAEKGYKVSLYLPLIPTEKIAKVFNSVEPQAL